MSKVVGRLGRRMLKTYSCAISLSDNHGLHY